MWLLCVANVSTCVCYCVLNILISEPLPGTTVLNPNFCVANVLLMLAANVCANVLPMCCKPCVC